MSRSRSSRASRQTGNRLVRPTRPPKSGSATIARRARESDRSSASWPFFSRRPRYGVTQPIGRRPHQVAIACRRRRDRPGSCRRAQTRCASRGRVGVAVAVSRGDHQRLTDIAHACDVVRQYLAEGDLRDGVVLDAVRIRLVEVGEVVEAISHKLLDVEWFVPPSALRRNPFVRDLVRIVASTPKALSGLEAPGVACPPPDRAVSMSPENSGRAAVRHSADRGHRRPVVPQHRDVQVVRARPWL